MTTIVVLALAAQVTLGQAPKNAGVEAAPPSAVSRVDRFHLGVATAQTVLGAGAMALAGGVVVSVEALAFMGGVFLGVMGSYVTDSPTVDWMSGVGLLGYTFMAVNTALFPFLGALVVNGVGAAADRGWKWPFWPTYLAGVISCAALSVATVGLLSANAPTAAFATFLVSPLTIALVQTFAANLLKVEAPSHPRGRRRKVAPGGPSPILLMAPGGNRLAGAGFGWSAAF